MLSLLLWVSLLQVPGATVSDPPSITVEGKGVQIYVCNAQSTWELKGPDAELYQDGKLVGSHSAGPRWTWNDGSAITGKLAAPRKAPDPAHDIPWLLLYTTPVEGTSGVLTPMVRATRTETHGGVAPADGCDQAHDGQTVRVPYTATYSFWPKR